MTSILILVASRHGATDEIAHEIADELRTQLPGSAVEVRDAAEPGDVTAADAVLVGSAVYLGRWLSVARDLLVSHRAALAAVPVWLFSSGPTGDMAPDELTQVTAGGATIGARGHRMFAGRLDRGKLSLVERLEIRIAGAATGDFRDHTAIRSWAAEVAAGLAAGSDVARR